MLTPAVFEPPQSYLVLGGNGFVGRHIVKALRSRGEESISVYSRSRPELGKAVDGVTYFCGDITDEAKLIECMRETGATIVFHTVSPRPELESDIYYQVNVDGTRAVLSACRSVGIYIIVFTSSTDAAWSGQIYSGVTEGEAKIVDKPYNLYSHTKGVAEKMILEANGVDGLKTVAMRPCGIIGPGDQHGMWRIVNAYAAGQYHFQMGDNKNYVNFCSAIDVAEAHLLAADKLCQPSSSGTVSGEAFSITDGCPAPFYTYPRAVWRELGAPKDAFVVVLPRWLCFTLAFFAEIWCRKIGGHTLFTNYLVTYATTEQWYNIDKARRLLGYEPRISLDEAVRDTVKWWREEGFHEHALAESRKTK